MSVGLVTEAIKFVWITDQARRVELACLPQSKTEAPAWMGKIVRWWDSRLSTSSPILSSIAQQVQLIYAVGLAKRAFPYIAMQPWKAAAIFLPPTIAIASKQKINNPLLKKGISYIQKHMGLVGQIMNVASIISLFSLGHSLLAGSLLASHIVTLMSRHNLLSKKINDLILTLFAAVGFSHCILAGSVKERLFAFSTLAIGAMIVGTIYAVYQAIHPSKGENN